MRLKEQSAYAYCSNLTICQNHSFRAVVVCFLRFLYFSLYCSSALREIETYYDMLNFKIARIVQAPAILLIAMNSTVSSGSFAKYMFSKFLILTFSAKRLVLRAMILTLFFN